MNREIKFRIWSKNNKIFYYTDSSPYVCHEYDTVSFYLTRPSKRSWDALYDFSSSVPLDIQQYTGFKDKSGREIYEGDILRYPLFGDPAEDSYLITSPVIFRNNKWQVDGLYGSDGLDERADFEIIGNNYENPELLK